MKWFPRLPDDDPLAHAFAGTVALVTSVVWWGAVLTGGEPRAMAIGFLVAIAPSAFIFHAVRDAKRPAPRHRIVFRIGDPE